MMKRWHSCGARVQVEGRGSIVYVRGLISDTVFRDFGGQEITECPGCGESVLDWLEPALGGTDRAVLKSDALLDEPVWARTGREQAEKMNKTTGKESLSLMEVNQILDKAAAKMEQLDPTNRMLMAISLIESLDDVFVNDIYESLRERLETGSW